MVRSTPFVEPCRLHKFRVLVLLECRCEGKSISCAVMSNAFEYAHCSSRAKFAHTGLVGVYFLITESDDACVTERTRCVKQKKKKNGVQNARARENKQE